MSSWHALHYNKIAKMIREKRDLFHERAISDQAWQQRELLLNELTLEWAEYFKDQENSGKINFDVDKFIKECGYAPRS